MNVNLSLSKILDLFNYTKSKLASVRKRTCQGPAAFSSSFLSLSFSTFIFQECSKTFCFSLTLSPISKDGYLDVYTFIISIVKENILHQPWLYCSPMSISSQHQQAEHCCLVSFFIFHEFQTMVWSKVFLAS